jgi:type IV secretion system protein VirB5
MTTAATTTTTTIPPSGYEFGEARRRYVAEYGSTLVMNTYLQLAVASLSAVIVALIVLNVHTQRTFRSFKPLVIRIDDVGHAAAVSYDSLAYTPQASELKYFIVQFVTMHYGRVRATVRQQYAQSLYFLDGRLADATIEANKKSGLIERFLAGATEEVEVRVKNVTLEDLRQLPYRATVDFDQIHLSPGTRAETRRESFVAHIVFAFTDQVDNARIPINPLGLTITYFREDQAFVNSNRP